MSEEASKERLSEKMCQERKMRKEHEKHKWEEEEKKEETGSRCHGAVTENGTLMENFYSEY